MKDIDNLQKRSRKLRDFAETMGSSGLAFTGLVGLLFLAILVWQITAPTFIDGEVEKFLLPMNSSPKAIMKWNGIIPTQTLTALLLLMQ